MKGNDTINMGDSDNFMSKYDGSNPGNYVWQVEGIQISSIDSLSFGSHPLSNDNTIQIKSDLKLKDMLNPIANNGWKLFVNYDTSDVATQKWEAAHLDLSFSPTSDQSFITPSSTLTVNNESQLVA